MGSEMCIRDSYKNYWLNCNIWIFYINRFNLFNRTKFILMRAVTKKWVFLKVSSLILVPLMLWFALNLVSIYDKSYLEILTFLTSQPSKFIFSLFLIFAYFFSALSISEVFEDYIKDEKIKNAANKALNFFAITIPLITIFAVFKLTI